MTYSNFVSIMVFVIFGSASGSHASLNRTKMSAGEVTEELAYLKKVEIENDRFMKLSENAQKALVYVNNNVWLAPQESWVTKFQLHDDEMVLLLDYLDQKYDNYSYDNTGFFSMSKELLERANFDATGGNWENVKSRQKLKDRLESENLTPELIDELVKSGLMDPQKIFTKALRNDDLASLEYLSRMSGFELAFPDIGFHFVRKSLDDPDLHRIDFSERLQTAINFLPDNDSSAFLKSLLADLKSLICFGDLTVSGKTWKTLFFNNIASQGVDRKLAETSLNLKFKNAKILVPQIANAMPGSLRDQLLEEINNVQACIENYYDSEGLDQNLKNVGFKKDSYLNHFPVAEYIHYGYPVTFDTNNTHSPKTFLASIFIKYEGKNQCLLKNSDRTDSGKAVRTLSRNDSLSVDLFAEAIEKFAAAGSNWRKSAQGGSDGITHVSIIEDCTYAVRICPIEPDLDAFHQFTPEFAEALSQKVPNKYLLTDSGKHLGPLPLYFENKLSNRNPRSLIDWKLVKAKKSAHLHTLSPFTDHFVFRTLQPSSRLESCNANNTLAAEDSAAELNLILNQWAEKAEQMERKVPTYKNYKHQNPIPR